MLPNNPKEFGQPESQETRLSRSQTQNNPKVLEVVEENRKVSQK